MEAKTRHIRTFLFLLENPYAKGPTEIKNHKSWKKTSIDTSKITEALNDFKREGIADKNKDGWFLIDKEGIFKNDMAKQIFTNNERAIHMFLSDSKFQEYFGIFMDFLNKAIKQISGRIPKDPRSLDLLAKKYKNSIFS